MYSLYSGLYGEVVPKRGTFFKLEVYERVGNIVVGNSRTKSMDLHSSHKKLAVCNVCYV